METNNNKELFFNLVSDEKSNIANELEDKVKNQDLRKESKVMAFKILEENRLKRRDSAKQARYCKAVDDGVDYTVDDPF